MKQFCVYTTLFGNYEKIIEQPVQKNSDIDFICFTDDENLTSDTWKIVTVQPTLPMDPGRSARMIKIAPHRYLPDYTTSLYIDNSIKLKVPPEEIFGQIMSKEYDLYCVRHSFRESVLDEFERVLTLKFDRAEKIIEQFNTYNLLDPDVFIERPYSAGFIIRNHNRKEIAMMMDDWLAQVLRFSRLDQLSLNYEIRKYGIDVKVIEIDNHSSVYHEWPTAERFGKQGISLSVKKSLETIVGYPPKTILSNVIEDFEELEQLYQKNKKELDDLKIELTNCRRLLQAEVDFYSNSRSWRITKPMREIMEFFRNFIKFQD